MEIIALQQYTDKFVSLYQGEIRNISDPLAERLIEQGIIAEHNEDGGSSKEEQIIIVKASATFNGGTGKFQDIKLSPDISNQKEKLILGNPFVVSLDVTYSGTNTHYYYTLLGRKEFAGDQISACGIVYGLASQIQLLTFTIYSYDPEHPYTTLQRAKFSFNQG